MPLPHFTQIAVNDTGGVGSKPHEPVYTNLFECMFVLPEILQLQGRDAVMMLQAATSITLNTTPDISVVDQRYKYSTRAFLTMPSQTHLEFEVKFNVNVNDAGAMETYNCMRAWYDLVWNSQTGALHYKADTIGTIIVNHHDRKGRIIRRVTYQNVQIRGIDGISLDWANADIWKDVSARFVADYWFEERVDGNMTIDSPFAQGY